MNHYRQHELPDMFNKTKPGPDAADEDRKSYATQVTYEGYLKKWILPRWGACRLADVKAVEVEKWLRTLCFKKTGLTLARGSKAKIRNIMSALYSHAIRWEWTDNNPITSVRQSAKRQKVPDVLTPEEIVAILAELPNPLRTMIELDAFTGLRRGELIGLRWEDVDFQELVLHVRRSVVAMVEGAPKTEVSQKDVPLDAQTAESLFAWRQTCPYPGPGDWVFASPAMKGRQPYWPGTQWRYYGKPALQRAKITKHVTYHTFRHTFGTLQCKRGESEGGAGTASSRQPESDHRCLYAGGEPTKAQGPTQVGEDGSWKKPLPTNWTKLDPEERRRFRGSSLFCWRPRRDLNPCYRRESRPRVRNCLKLNGTDSPLGHLSDCGDGLSDC